MSDENFKLSELVYVRVTIESFEKEASEIISKFKAAKTGEEQFDVHKKYYALMDKVSTLIALAGMRNTMGTFKIIL